MSPFCMSFSCPIHTIAGHSFAKTLGHALWKCNSFRCKVTLRTFEKSRILALLFTMMACTGSVIFLPNQARPFRLRNPCKFQMDKALKKLTLATSYVHLQHPHNTFICQVFSMLQISGSVWVLGSVWSPDSLCSFKCSLNALSSS